ncbi:hypothetical protein ACFLT1_05675, partial [Bacteroidota bacterium]
SPVEDVWVNINGTLQQTSSNGQTTFSLSAGSYTYSIMTNGTSETIIIGSNTITYKDLGGNGTSTNAYDNIFLYDEPLTVAGSKVVTVDLPVVTFLTTDNGTGVPAPFFFSANYLNPNSQEQLKVIAELTTGSDGSLALPVPTHRNAKYSAAIMPFYNYTYSEEFGITTGTFDPTLGGTVEIALPIQNDVSLAVNASGVAVEGLTVNLGGYEAITDANGEVVFSIPDGDYNYNIYSSGTPETLIIGTDTLTYLDLGGYGSSNKYDNIFVHDALITVSGATTLDVPLYAPTFNTTENGSAVNTSFNITANYLNRGGTEKLKSVVSVASGDDGSIILPLPSHRNDRYNDTLAFYNFIYTDEEGFYSDTFEIASSTVDIIVPVRNAVTFNVTAGGIPVEGLIIGINGYDYTAATDAAGSVVFSLPEGVYGYSGFLSGDDEVLIISNDTISYEDFGSSTSYTDKYDNFFVSQDTMTVSGARINILSHIIVLKIYLR